MLIKLRIKFYQVQCDAFVELATELLDIPATFRRAVAYLHEKPVFPQTCVYYCDGSGVENRVDIHLRRHNIAGTSSVEGESTCDAFLEESDR